VRGLGRVVGAALALRVWEEAHHSVVHVPAAGEGQQAVMYYYSTVFLMVL